MKFRNDFERRCWIAVVHTGTDFADEAVRAFRERSDRIGFREAQAAVKMAATLARQAGIANLAAGLEEVNSLLERTER